MESTNYWKGKRVLITGGTAGLGRELALKSAAYGAKVVVVGRNKERLGTITENPAILGIQGDVSIREDIHKISGQAIGQLGGLDALFNNASYLGMTPMRLLVDTEWDDLEKVLQTNVLGPFLLTKAILPTMLLNKSGLIVNISSDAAVGAYPTWGGYSISKIALDHLSRIWHEELKAENIQFLAIDPGDMNTAMHLAAIPDADTSALYDPTQVAEDLLTFLSKTTSFEQVRYGADEWRAHL